MLWWAWAADCLGRDVRLLWVPCLLAVFGSFWEVAALLGTPMWWVTKLVGVLLAALWGVLVCILGLALFRLAVSLDWMAMPIPLHL